LSLDPNERLGPHVGVSVTRCRREQNAELPAILQKADGRDDDSRIGGEQTTKQRAPRKVDRHLVRDVGQLGWKPFDAFDQERRVR